MVGVGSEMVFISIGARVEVNVEALNAVETVGNVTKHRRAPIVVPLEGGYRLVYVPAVSGESIANAYQRNLVNAAKLVYEKDGLKAPLTPWDERYEFVKFMDKQHLTGKLLEIVASKEEDLALKKHMFEKEAIVESIVADVGGFLYAEEEMPVKRTSRLQVGYMVPVFDALENVAIEAQFHARHVPSETGARGKKPAQMIYYVEVASAVYGLTVNLDTSSVGKTSLVKVEDAVDADERKRRVKAALLALAGLFAGEGFGAKLSRFLPIKRVVSMVATLSDPIAFVVSPPQIPEYIVDTCNRVSSVKKIFENMGLKAEIEILAYGKELPEMVERADSVEELLAKLIDKVMRKL